jgi:type II secretory pathway pseudopilin PulG
MYRRSSSSHPESGYILLAVLFMVALILIALAVAAPKIASDIQRDRENDLYHRGEQYKRAIKLYYKKFGRYPSSIDQLENTNNMRFLRKRYVDPMTGKDDWKLIHYGEAHVQPLGLFGQPIQGGGMAAIAGGSVPGGGMAATAGGSVLGGAAAASGGMYAPTVGTPIAGSTSSSSSSSSTDSGTSTTSGTDSSGSSASGTSGTPTTGTGMGSTPGFGGGGGSSFGGGSSSFGGSSSGSSGFGSSSTGSSGFGSSGSSFGGAPIVGIASKNTKASIKEYKKQKHYNEWEFVYDPMEDLLSSVSLFGGGTSNVNGTSGTSPSGTTTSGTSGSGYGNSGSGSGFGGSTGGFGSSTGGFGSSTGSGSTPTSPQQPQQ